jgi:hypothetical protein
MIIGFPSIPLINYEENEGVNNVNISQIPCEKSHSNRNACSVYLDTFPNPFYEKRKRTRSRGRKIAVKNNA